jgi:hypothetical protein
MKNFIIVLLTNYCTGGKVEKNGMGGECSTYGGEERRVGGSVGETLGKDRLREPRVDWRIILRRIFRK